MPPSTFSYFSVSRTSMRSMLSVSAGMRDAYQRAGDPNRAIVVSKGADQEGQSAIARAQAPVIADAPGIARGGDGKPLADRGIQVGVPVLRKDGSKGYTTMRGLSGNVQGVALRGALEFDIY